MLTPLFVQRGHLPSAPPGHALTGQQSSTGPMRLSLFPKNNPWVSYYKGDILSFGLITVCWSDIYNSPLTRPCIPSVPLKAWKPSSLFTCVSDLYHVTKCLKEVT